METINTLLITGRQITLNIEIGIIGYLIGLLFFNLIDSNTEDSFDPFSGQKAGININC